MSNHHYALSVVLEKPLHEDETERLKEAILMLRHVVSVEGHVADMGFHGAKMQARLELERALWNALKQPDGPDKLG